MCMFLFMLVNRIIFIIFFSFIFSQELQEEEMALFTLSSSALKDT